MTDYQFGWRMRLVLESWRSGGILPADTRLLAQLARANSVDVFRREMGVVLYDFEDLLVEGEPALINREIADLYAEQYKIYQQRCDAASKAAEARREKRESASEAHSQ